MVGTVVNLSLAGDLARRLQSAAVRRLASDGVLVATNPQVLVNPVYGATNMRLAARTVAAHVPAGPYHARLVAVETRHLQQLLAQVFAALRLSLAIAIQHGLVAVLVVCGLACLVACFVTDVPPAQQSGAAERDSPRA
jgi:hypothetical protein